jgi:hypothetical protein
MLNISASTDTPVTQKKAEPGLTRISHLKTGGNTYVYIDKSTTAGTAGSGEGVVAYVVDTGIRITHEVYFPCVMYQGAFTKEQIGIRRSCNMGS